MATIIDPLAKKWESNSTKRQNDLLIAEVLDDIGVFSPENTVDGECVSFLTFPAKDWCFEQALARLKSDKLPCKFLGLERDYAVWSLMVKNAAKLNEEQENAAEYLTYERPIELSAYLYKSAIERSMDVMYLDYMGTWNPGIEWELNWIFEHNLLGKCLIITVGYKQRNYRQNEDTFELANRLTIEEVSEIAQAFSDVRVKKNPITELGNRALQSIPVWVKRKAAQHGINLVPVKTFLYDSECETMARCNPEITFVFERQDDGSWRPKYSKV